jgi:hypothetical protein
VRSAPKFIGLFYCWIITNIVEYDKLTKSHKSPGRCTKDNISYCLNDFIYKFKRISRTFNLLDFNIPHGIK